MAYERTWTFAPQVGPLTPASSYDETALLLFQIKELLVGNWGGAITGLWTVEGSSDSVTGAFDGVDRWATKDNVVAGAGPTNPCGWIVLKSPLWTNGVYFYLMMANNLDNSSVGSFVVRGSTSPYALRPSYSTGYPITTGIGDTMNANYISTTTGYSTGVRYYGALSASGDFWFTCTNAGNAICNYIISNPVGVKGQDQYPIFHHCRFYSNANYAFIADSLLASSAGLACKQYNGAAGYQWIHNSIPAKALLDSADTSLFDFPAWVMVGDQNSLATSTTLHSRGRLPDIGVISGKGSANGAPFSPVSNGNTVRDNLNAIKYVTCGCLLLPYNATIT